MTLKDRFLRWKRSKGYGIHSPLAFRLIWRVVTPDKDKAYYGEEYLEGMAPPGLRGYRRLRQAQMLLRFVADVQPDFVWTPAPLPEIMREAISRAGCVIRIFEGTAYLSELDKAEMVVLDGEKLSAKLLPRVMKPGKSMIAFNVPESFVRRVAAELKCGVMLEGIGSFIAIFRDDVSPMVYSVKRF